MDELQELENHINEMYTISKESAIKTDDSSDRFIKMGEQIAYQKCLQMVLILRERKLRKENENTKEL